jgi:hypothetical protein
VIGGDFTSVNSVARSGLARLNDDGTLDADFFNDPNGRASGSKSIAIQQDGRVLVGGSFTNFNGAAGTGLVRLHPDGSLDTEFSVMVPAVHSVVIQRDGKVLIGGDFRSVNRIGRWYVARLMGDPPLRAALNIAPFGRDLKIWWRSPAHSVALEENSTIVPSGWTEVSSPPTYDSTTSTVVVPGETAGRFYRLRPR